MAFINIPGKDNGTTLSPDEFNYFVNKVNSLKLAILQGSGFIGALRISDTPDIDGWYFATESGIYTNAGNLSVELSGQLNVIIVSNFGTTFSLVTTPIPNAGGLLLKGAWNALTNTPDVSISPELNTYWIVDTAGSTVLGTESAWTVGDWAVYTSDGWIKIDGNLFNIDSYSKAETDGKYLLNTTDTLTGDLTVTNIIGASNLSGTNTGDQVSSDFTHNSLTGVSADEHIDWTLTNAKNIHADNYTDTVYDSTAVDTHIANVTTNPHNVTKTNVGLSNVDNTSDSAKPVSILTQTALDGKVDDSQVLTNVPSGALFTDTTYTSSDFTHNDLSGVSANEHIDWTGTSTGTIHITNLPATAITSVQISATEVAMLALTTQEGDVVVRSDENKTYMHNGGTAGTMADFTELATPTSDVTSVDGATGAVTLNHDSLTGFVSNEHIDWTTDQGATNIHAGNYTDTTYDLSGYLLNTTDTLTGVLTVDGGTGVNTSGGTLIVKQKGDTISDGIAITSSNASSHRIWKDASGNLNIGGSSAGSSFVQDLSGNLSILGTTSAPKFYVGTAPTTSVWVFHMRNSASTADSGLYFNSGSGNLFLRNSSNTLTTRIDSNGVSYFNGGNVGIGTDAPLEKLEVQGTVYATPITYAANQSAYALKMGASNNTAFDMGIRAKSTSGGSPYMSLCSHNTEDVIVVQNSNVGINKVSPAYNLDVSGTGRFTAAVTATNFILSSDKRLKNNVEEVNNNHIDVNWKTFEMNSEEGQSRYGVIAQELEEVHPEFVRTDKEGMKSVAYIDLLIAKIAELEARLDKANI